MTSDSRHISGKVAAIAELEAPSTVKEFSRFVQDFSRIANSY